MIKPSPAVWIVLGLIVAALEMVVPGFILIWFGVAAVATGILAFFVKNGYVQLGVFVGLSALLVTTSQLISRRITKPEPEPVGANRLVGVTGQVLQPIGPGQAGRVKVVGEEWRAEADVEIVAGVKVRVLRVEGTHLVVEPAAERS